MRLLEQVAPRVIPARAIDILDVGPEHRMSRGLVHVDVADPVFFDHPLDHLPGILLAVAGLELAEHASMFGPGNATFRLSFTRFGELGAPVEVTAVRDFGGINRIDFLQSGRSIATGSLMRSDILPRKGFSAAPALQRGSIARALVHRTDPRNVAIGPLTMADGCVWTRVREQGAIGGLPPRAGAVASIIEAARQLTVAILHRWGGHPMGTKMIFVGLTAEVPTTMPPGQLARALSWQVTPPEQTRKLHFDVCEIDDGATIVGSILIATRCVDGVEYAQLRA